MNHNSIRSLAMIAGAALLLTACGGGTDDTSTDGKTTIRYSNFISNGGNEKNLDKIVAAFEQQHPEITVDVTTLPYNDYFTALQTDIAGGTEADVFDIEYANFANYASSGVLAPLDDVDTSAIQPSLAQTYQFDGSQLALPSSFSNVVLYYNKDLFDAAGLDYPTDKWTWKDEKAAAEALSDGGAGVFGDYQPISYNEYYKAVAQSGGQFLSDDGTKAAFDSPEGVAAAEWLVKKSGTTMPTVEQGAGTPDYDSGLFLDGKLAMWHTGIWMIDALAEAPFAWDIAVEPGNTKKASAMFSNAVAVSVNSDHVAAAQQWAEFLSTSSAAAEVRLDAGWELPPISDKSVLSTYVAKDNPANRQAVFDSLDAVALAPSIGKDQAEMQDIVTEALSEAAAGRMSPQEAVTSAAEQVNKLLN